MTEDMLRQALDRMPVGYALHKIIIDDEGSPCDYEYVEANRAFEEATGLVAAEIVGKRVTEVIPNIKSDEFDWIRKYSEVALKGQTLDFEQHSSSLNKIFKVNAFSPKVGFFITLVNDVTKENETNRKLVRELGNQKELQSALTRDAIFTTQATLTQNKIIHGLEYYDEYIKRIHYDYDAWFEYAKLNVQQEYRADNDQDQHENAAEAAALVSAAAGVVAGPADEQRQQHGKQSAAANAAIPAGVTAKGTAGRAARTTADAAAAQSAPAAIRIASAGNGFFRSAAGPVCRTHIDSLHIY